MKQCWGSCEPKYGTVSLTLVRSLVREYCLNAPPRWVCKHRGGFFSGSHGLRVLAGGYSCSGKHWAGSLYKSQEVHAKQLLWKGLHKTKKDRKQPLSRLHFTADLHRRRNTSADSHAGRCPGKVYDPWTERRDETLPTGMQCQRIHLQYIYDMLQQIRPCV